VKPWLTEQWCIPLADPEFVYRMEDVLAVYQRPYDPTRPLVCLDETSRIPLRFTLVADAVPPDPVAPGQPARQDYEYVRHGVRNLFLTCEPLRGWRHVTVSERRTRQDFAHVIRDLVDVRYPQAERIVLVLDQLNTHTPASLYDTFEPAEAKRLTEKLAIHYTPKHGSWLNMAEIELAVLSTQCLDRRLGDPATLTQEVAAWEARRNTAAHTIDWRFTTTDARLKLKRLYPIIH
jgi:DDE superfamily endonuclease